MRVEVVDDAAALARRAAAAIAAAARPGCNIGLPTGNTPVDAYRELARMAAAGDADLSQTRIWAVDEFAGCAADAAGTNRAFFAAHLPLPVRELHIPDASAPDPNDEAHSFAAALRDAGGLDLCVLGVGTNGHVAFNEPGSEVASRARAVDLAETSRRAHAASFGSLGSVPHRGITLGIADLLEARSLLVMATGAAKAAIVAAAIDGAPTPDVPASLLRNHSDITWLLDRAAAAQLRSQ